jgi:hypothetical protein
VCHIEVLLLALVICYGSFQNSHKSIGFMSSAETINILATFLYLFVSEDIEGIILHYNPVVSEKLNGTVSAAFVFFFNKHHLLHNGPKL